MPVIHHAIDVFLCYITFFSSHPSHAHDNRGRNGAYRRRRAFINTYHVTMTWHVVHLIYNAYPGMVSSGSVYRGLEMSIVDSCQIHYLRRRDRISVPEFDCVLGGEILPVIGSTNSLDFRGQHGDS